MSRLFCLVAIVCAFASTGCHLLGGGLDVKTIASGAEPPSNVAVYLSVADGDEPITDLAASNFTLLENGQAIDASKSKLTLLDRDVAALHRTLLLVDMSTAKDDASTKQLSRGVNDFVGTVRRHQAVTVYAFDGRASLQLIGDYPKQADHSGEELPALTSFKTQDPSRNLNGAIVEGLKQLDARLMANKKPVRVGTLVVLTSGPDLAGRATADAVSEALSATSHQVVAVGVGEQPDFDLKGIGKDGVTKAPSLAMAGIGLDEAASRVQALLERHYLLSYCSPARAGQRRLTVEIKRMTLEGEEQKGKIEVDFDATGFGPGCDPSRPPRFVQNAGNAKPTETPAEAPKTEPKTTAPGGGEKKPTGEAPAGDDAIVPPPNQPGYAPLPEKKK